MLRTHLLLGRVGLDTSLWWLLAGAGGAGSWLPHRTEMLLFFLLCAARLLNLLLMLLWSRICGGDGAWDIQ